MTTLNTIIEEEKDKIFCKYDFGYMNGTTVGVIEDLNNDLDTAMQRAYEAGANNERASWLRSEIEKLKDRQRGWLGKEEDGSDRHECYDELQLIITRYKEELLELENGK